MTRSIEIVLARLEPYGLRENSRDRWRACCPAHGGKNPNTLSVGIGDNDAVLLHCWSGCEAEEVVHALGLEMHDLFPAKFENGHGAPALRRRRLLTPMQMLQVIEFETTLVYVAAQNLAAGFALTDSDRERLSVAARRILTLATEVRS